MSISDLIASEADAAERNPDAPIKPGSKVTRGHQRAKTLQVRLNVEEFDALTHLAEQRGLPVSTLARDLLLSHLAGSDDSAKSLIARIRAELDDLATRVA
ncbi:MAG: CopG family transcriptional regulator [Brooklawnia sp.]|jgi:DNA-binding response OmpR family regulator|uniref:ribbon-helix-helix domain-containing protein n=1 Tax=Brooklawnia sp. TaxID=2699740 RepID=UPI003C749329